MITRGPLRVLMTADAIGGVWTYALDLARALGPLGVDVSLAVMGPLPTGDQRREAARAGVCVHARPYRLEWMEEPWVDVENASAWLLELERRIRPDVVHLNGYCHATLPWRAPVLLAAHSCVLSWWRAVHGIDAPESWSRYAREVERGLHAAVLVTAPTKAMLRSIEAHYGALSNTSVIPNGRRMVLPSARARKQPFVLTAGRLWDAAKNVEAVCAVAHEIPWPVHVAGDIDRPLSRLTGHAPVRYLGRLSPGQLASWMARTSIYVLPARYEPFGLSAVEAALAGCALVLGDIDSLREVWGEAAVYVTPNDHRMLAAALRALIEGDAVRREMARRALTRARELTPQRMAAAYAGAYDTVLDGHGPAKVSRP